MKYFFMILFIINFLCCIKIDINYREEMRTFVKNISSYAKSINSSFLIIPQNGVDIITENGEHDGAINQAYIDAIDGQGQEDLYYGYSSDDSATLSSVTEFLKGFLDIEKNSGLTILITDYCSTHSKIEDSYIKNYSDGYISFASPTRSMDIIPDYPNSPYNVNTNDITELNLAKNFLYIINPEKFSTADDFISALKNTDYDLILIDLFFEDNTELTATQVSSLKIKSNGGKRLVICYMSIGEAEDYRYYWKNAWNTFPPFWLDKENPDWEGNYKVKYWKQAWQDIIYGNDDSYLKKILDANFDGVYLDIIDAYEYFENK